MNFMASTLLLILAVVGIVIFVADLNLVDSSLLVPADPMEKSKTPTTTAATLAPETTTTTMATTTVRPFSCKRMMLSMAKKVFKQFGICNRDMKVFIPSEKEREKRLQCSVKCVLKKMKIVNEKDLINEDSMKNFLDTFLPADYHEVALLFAGGCIEEFVEKGEAPLHEDYCDSYGEFLRCLQDKMQSICST